MHFFSEGQEGTPLGDRDPDLYNKIMALSKRRGIIWPSYDLYGGTAGFFDYGPMGNQIKLNIEDIWRRYYVIGEGFEEIQTPIVAGEAVFKASGHLTEFSDFLVECSNCNDAFRADHLVADLVENADALPAEELDQLIKENDVKCPTCGGTLSYPEPFNLMFRTNIGPGGKKVGYLRPETAQGMFLNFLQLYRHAREKLPFGVCQIGTVFRNEISPRQGMIRLREFNQAECEIFVHPDEKDHRAFDVVANDKLNLVPAEAEAGEYTIGDALGKNIIRSQIVAYYVALTGRYLLEIGLDPKRLRFRQHGSDEMAHYASDCWDAEAETSFGWIELVGIADRTCFDLDAHTEHSGQELKAFLRYDEPKEFRVRRVVAHHKVLGPLFKKDAKVVKEALEALDPSEVEGKDRVTVKVGGKDVEVPTHGFEIMEREIKESGQYITPHVIEPSYGIDRIVYALIEHAYFETKKEGEEYRVLRLRSTVAPIKVGVFPLMARDGLPEMAMDIIEAIRSRGIRSYFDESGTVGRRYARMDEIGTPWCVTVDYDSKDDNRCTIRDRDTTEQVRVGIEDVPDMICQLLDGKKFDDLK